MKKLNDDKRNIPYQRGNQRDKSPHYVFLYSDDEVDDEEVPLQVRKHKSTPRKVEVIVVNLKPEDTLQALALRYHCTISELKRINSIHKENEIFARRTLKVPIQPFSILTETEKLIDIEDEPAALHPSTSNAQLIINLPKSDSTLKGFVSKDESDINTLILNSVCEPVNKFTGPDLDIDDECNELLPGGSRDSTPEAQVINSLRCSGADWGLSFLHLLLLILLLAIVLPIIYIFYIAEHPQHIIVIDSNFTDSNLIENSSVRQLK
ncbi:GSCOCG00010481001-RA-CDS [Cotesia congregata]|uniref:Similar to lysmd4: LysM and putative peptidoglycan-binding domain-containing protein 4 (Danio rerio) n=1 Tax=Cotesia congregata TaxID=51543 RepID=A0A8J2H8P0_COTCN|nr:GSCOCG00010481001-RA-CDS [Cotesia congregata]CAG5085310.1 Similar to lysmd4: LysM and putative peptidoglycan-binding domain-containing protein 4 (Danio rerio) [Cotesia congregata]